MSDLTPVDLANYTQGRLDPANSVTQDLLNAALQYLRSYCSWHVTPVVTNDIVALDGPGEWGGWVVGTGSIYGSGYTGTGTLRKSRPGGETAYLPTKRLQSISSVLEDGVALDLTTLQFNERGAVQKINGGRWTTNMSNGSGLTSGLQFTFTHGWTESEAADWRRIALMIADRMSMVRGLIGPFPVEVGNSFKVAAHYGTSRAGTLPMDAGWLDDLTGMVDTNRYVRVTV